MHPATTNVILATTDAVAWGLSLPVRGIDASGSPRSQPQSEGSDGSPSMRREPAIPAGLSGTGE